MAHSVGVHVHIGNKRTSSSGGSRRSSRRKTGKRRSGTARRGTYAGARAGSGKNFRALSNSLSRRGARNPGALAAYIGRRKYGNAGFQQMAIRGRRRAGRSRGRRRG